MNNTIKLLTLAIQANSLALDTQAIKKLTHYLELMQTWNRVFNLTTITETRDMVYLHLIDSLAILPHLHGTRLLDVGSGAGLPGIPLAIADPQKHWVLMDKNSKKTRFLTQAVAELGLTNVEVIHSRCEDFHPAHCFDSILSRAFGTIGMFVETTQHLLCSHGQFIAMKGKYPQEELTEIPEHYSVLDVARLNIKGMDAERHIVRLVKKS
jgi:16S rRNA (guanine527-N7)-methyltransferase